MTDKLPKTIVVPKEAYQFALNLLTAELWSEKALDRLLAVFETIEQCEPDIDTVQWRDQSRTELLRLPFWRRPEALERWPDEEQISLFATICEAGRAPEPRDENLRLSTRRFLSWMEETPNRAEPSKNDRDRIERLAWTNEYAAWLSMGGDADVGRYLGCWAIRMIRTST